MDALATLKSEEARLRTELAKIQRAIAALNGTSHQSRTAAKPNSVRRKRKLSAAGRARIVAALKARWAKVKATQKKGK